MNVCLFDQKKNKWLPKKKTKEFKLIFEPIINKTLTDVSFGTIMLSDCEDLLIKSIKSIVKKDVVVGILYSIKKIEGECMYSVCFRDIDNVELKLSDVRHSIKNYLNGLVWAEYELNGNNDIISDATKEVNNIQIEHLMDLFIN